MPDAWTPSSELESLSDEACRGSLNEDGADRLAILLRDRRACRWLHPSQVDRSGR